MSDIWYIKDANKAGSKMATGKGTVASPFTGDWDHIFRTKIRQGDVVVPSGLNSSLGFTGNDDGNDFIYPQCRILALAPDAARLALATLPGRKLSSEITLVTNGPVAMADGFQLKGVLLDGGDASSRLPNTKTQLLNIRSNWALIEDVRGIHSAGFWTTDPHVPDNDRECFALGLSGNHCRFYRCWVSDNLGSYVNQFALTGDDCSIDECRADGTVEGGCNTAVNVSNVKRCAIRNSTLASIIYNDTGLVDGIDITGINFTGKGSSQSMINLANVTGLTSDKNSYAQAI